jgi:hypothetical protein
MPNPIVAYDDGLQHSVFHYVTDANVTFNVSIRTAYIDDGVTVTVPQPPHTPVNKPKALKPRHLILTSKDGNNGKYLVRRVPCNVGDIGFYFGPGKTIPATVTVDGEQFLVTGFHGESWRG